MNDWYWFMLYWGGIDLLVFGYHLGGEGLERKPACAIDLVSLLKVGFWDGLGRLLAEITSTLDPILFCFVLFWGDSC